MKRQKGEMKAQVLLGAHWMARRWWSSGSTCSYVQRCHWAVTLVSTWLQLQLPCIEDGSNLGGILQVNVWADDHPSHQAGRLPHSNLQGFLWAEPCGQATPCVQLSKAGVQAGWGRGSRTLANGHVYLQHLCAVLYDIILRNLERLKNPRGETKGMMYWELSLIPWWVLPDLSASSQGLQTFLLLLPAKVSPSPYLPGTTNIVILFKNLLLFSTCFATYLLFCYCSCYP